MKRALHSYLFKMHFLLTLTLLSAGICSAQTYCTPTDVCSDNDFINSFSTTGGTTNITNNSTGCTGGGYNYYPTMIHTGIPGGTVNFSFTNNPYWGEYYKIWVDWNSNGTFESSEMMYASSSSILSSATVTGSFTIPAATTAGNKRLRIRCGYAESALDPCLASLIGDGETEDYIVTVGSLACSGIPAGGTTTAAASAIPCNTTTTLALTGNASGNGLTYQWQYNNSGTWVNFGTNLITQTTPAVTQNTQFRCQITCTNPGGGSANSTPVTVSVINPTLNIGNDTTICPGISYVLNTNTSGATYSWSTGATTQSITVNTANTYSVKVTFANGCKANDTIVITPGIVPVNVLPATTNLCVGDTAVLNAGNSGSSFLWTPGAQTTQSVSTTAPGNHSVLIKSINGCKITSTTNIIPRPLPIANLGNDTSICNGDHIQLDAGNPGYSYSWSNGANTQIITASDSGTYNLTTTSPYNCFINENIHISYLPAPFVEGFNFIPQFYEKLGQVLFSPLNPTNVTSYDWDFGDNSPHSTAINPTHTYAASAYYDVTIKVINGCGTYQTSLPIHVDIVTGIVTLNKTEAHVDVYPNPSSSYIVIENNSADLKMEQVTIYNILGAQVYTQHADSRSKHQLNVSAFTSGLYTARILTDKGFVVRKFEVIK